MSMGGALNPRVVLWHKGPNLHRYTLLRCFVFLLNISKSQHVTWDEQDERKESMLAREEGGLGIVIILGYSVFGEREKE